jgi:hypothetical protein
MSSGLNKIHCLEEWVTGDVAEFEDKDIEYEMFECMKTFKFEADSHLY